MWSNGNVVFFVTILTRLATTVLMEICPVVLRNTTFSCSGGELKRIDFTAFAQHLPNMTHLDVSRNTISFLTKLDVTVPADTRLLSLNLSYNRLTKLDSDVFLDGFDQLATLDLSFNKLRQLDRSMFIGLHQLTRLNLSGNPIALLGNDSFEEMPILAYLDLSLTRLICDCDLQWFHSWLTTKAALVSVSKEARCFMPVNLQGQRLMDVPRNVLNDCESKVELPLFELLPSENQIVTVGDSLTLRCSFTTIRTRKPHASSVSGTIMPEWYHNSVKVALQIVENSPATGGVQTSNLILSPVTEKHEGNWTCQIGGDKSRVNENKSLTIHVYGPRTDCQENITATTRGDYRWLRTPAKNVTMSLPCAESDSKGIATHVCGFDGKWKMLNVSGCMFSATDDRALELYSQTPSAMAASTSVTLNTFLSNWSPDTAEQLELVLNGIEHLRQTGMVDPRLDLAALDLESLKTIDHILDFPMKVFRQSLAETVGSRISALLQQIAVRLKPQQTISLRNFAIKVIGSPELSVVHSCIVSKPDNVTVLSCTKGNPVSAEGSMIHIPALTASTKSQSRLVVLAFASLKLFATVLPTDVAPSSFVMGVFAVDDKEIPPSLASPLTFDVLLPRIPEAPNVVSFSAALRVMPENCVMLTVNYITNSARVSCQEYALVMIYHSRDRVVPFHSNELGFLASPMILIAIAVAVAAHLTLMFIYAFHFAMQSLDKGYQHSLLNIWTAVVFLLVVFAVGFNQTADKRLCQSIAVVLHYLTLCVSSWILVAFYTMFRRISKRPALYEDCLEADAEKLPTSFGGVYLFGWGVPTIICGISVAVSLPLYGNQLYCYLTTVSSLVAVIAPCGLVVVISVCLCIFILCSKKSPADGALVGQLPFDSFRSLQRHAMILLIYLILLTAVASCLTYWTYLASTGKGHFYSWTDITCCVLLSGLAAYVLLSFWLTNHELPKTCWTSHKLVTDSRRTDQKDLSIQRESCSLPGPYRSAAQHFPTYGPSISTQDECFAVKHYTTPGTVSELLTNGRDSSSLQSPARSRCTRNEERLPLHYVSNSDGLYGSASPRVPQHFVSRTNMNSSLLIRSSDSAKMETCM